MPSSYQASVWLGVAWDVLVWLGIVWHGLVKLNYQVSLLTLDGVGWVGEKSKLKLNPALAELGHRKTRSKKFGNYKFSFIAVFE